jgi:hypothetical protein
VCEGGACHFRLASGGICVSGTVQQQQQQVSMPSVAATKASVASRKSLGKIVEV